MSATRPDHLLRSILALLAALVCVAGLSARADDWSVGPAPGGDSQGKAATITNAGGETLYIWAKHLQDRSLVFAELHLGEGDEFAGRMPSYRIDSDEPVDTELVRREGEKQGSLWGFVAGRASFWLLWSSNQETVNSGDHLAKWMGGKTLRITYQDADGSQKIAAFDLVGARGAIEGATGLTLH
jgi:hypothetical protein